MVAYVCHIMVCLQPEKRLLKNCFSSYFITPHCRKDFWSDIRPSSLKRRHISEASIQLVCDHNLHSYCNFLVVHFYKQMYSHMCKKNSETWYMSGYRIKNTKVRSIWKRWTAHNDVNPLAAVTHNGCFADAQHRYRMHFTNQVNDIENWKSLLRCRHNSRFFLTVRKSAWHSFLRV